MKIHFFNIETLHGDVVMVSVLQSDYQFNKYIRWPRNCRIIKMNSLIN